MQEKMSEPISIVMNYDCLPYMKTVPDKFFDLVIPDVPYGINASEMTMGSGTNKKYRKGKKWDLDTPDSKYWKELFRISKNQIIFGGNYFILPLSRGWIFWDKGIDGDCSFADGELIWTSFDTVLRKAQIRYKGFLGMDRDERIHITQKPITLYSWILQNYAKPGDKIFDSHMGSQSSRIAAYKLGFDYWGCELDEDYFRDGCARFDRECLGEITTSEGIKITQQKLF